MQYKPKSIIVISTLKSDIPHNYAPTALSRGVSSNFPIYKSNLQKCIRRGLADHAMRTMYAMLSVDEADTLRRLPIIMLEDTLPHPSLLPLVWWMMATSKGYKLSDSEIEYILGIVSALCNLELYEVFNEFCKPPKGLKWSHLPPLQKDLIWAMEFRKAYRGMWCDTRMIEYLEGQWVDRFDRGSILWKYILEQPIPPIDLGTLGVCDKEDIIPEAIDQHCVSWIITKLASTYPYDEYSIKGAIWFYRSSLNIRSVCPGSKRPKYVAELLPIYEAIKVDLYNLSEWVCKKWLV